MVTETVSIDSHPLLRAGLLAVEFGVPLGERPTPAPVLDLLAVDAPAPLQRDEQLRADVRDLLRHGGYKPTGRGKPASEYLVKAATDGRLGPINAAVDVCNAVSLHSGLPISVVDLDRTSGPLRIAMAEPGTAYVFNASGQEIDVGGLLCLFDGDGPCANAVKDSQRTKTSDATTRTLSVVWGCTAHAERLETALEWYASLFDGLVEGISYRVK